MHPKVMTFYLFPDSREGCDNDFLTEQYPADKEIFISFVRVN